TRLPRASSSLTLNISREGASTTSLGNLFQFVKAAIKPQCKTNAEKDAMATIKQQNLTLKKD
uniref:Uncharacterized protein n=1 Tax=Calidris pygmaea TaxID=425635 RepID=A0A8C3KFE1_9CHAR